MSCFTWKVELCQIEPLLQDAACPFGNMHDVKEYLFKQSESPKIVYRQRCVSVRVVSSDRIMMFLP